VLALIPSDIFQLVGKKLKTPVPTRWNSTYDSVRVMNKILKEPEARLVNQINSGDCTFQRSESGLYLSVQKHKNKKNIIIF
jgi:hypothetical protein